MSHLRRTAGRHNVVRREIASRVVKGEPFFACYQYFYSCINQSPMRTYSSKTAPSESKSASSVKEHVPEDPKPEWQAQAIADAAHVLLANQPPAAKDDPMLEYMTADGVDNVVPSTLDKKDVRETFRLSVEARTVGNNQLRKFVKYMNHNDYQMALDAAQGCRDGGLKLESESYDAIVRLLLRAGQLRQALELYQQMVQTHTVPLTKTYNNLIELCVDKGSAYAARSLFNDMEKRGRQADFETYELMMRACAVDNPPQWEMAVAIFDKLQRHRTKDISAKTYNALMTVYLNMQPFDYRIVYNAYYEMRYRRPRIPFGWDSHKLVDQALKKGYAGPWIRITTFVDAWANITEFRSVEFWVVALAMCSLMMVIRYVLVRMVIGAEDYMTSQAEGDSESGVLEMRDSVKNFE